MPTAALVAPLGVAIVLIVVGRLNHGVRWGDRVAIAGYALLALTIVVGLAARG
jgi:hypothetical protein